MPEKHEVKERLIRKIARRIARGEESPLEDVAHITKTLHRLTIRDLEVLNKFFSRSKKRKKK